MQHAKQKLYVCAASHSWIQVDTKSENTRTRGDHKAQNVSNKVKWVMSFGTVCWVNTGQMEVDIKIMIISAHCPNQAMDLV